MAKIDIPGLRAKSTAGGRRYYWEPSATLKRAGWKAMPLCRDPLEAHKKAEARNQEIEDWRSGGAKPRAVRAFVKRATVDALIERYKAGPFLNLADNTKREYASKLKTIAAWAGSEPVLAITRKNVRTLRDTLMQPDADGVIRHTTAHATLRVLRTLLKYAVDEELIPDNQAKDFALGAPAPRQQVASPEAREALLASADAAQEPNMALAMLLGWSTGQRESDLLRTLLSQYVEIPAYKLDPEVHASLAAMAPDSRVMGVRLRQGKGKKWIEVPVIGDVRQRIEAAIAAARALGLTTILYNERDGRPWSTAEHKEYLARQTIFQRRIAQYREAAAAIAAKAGIDWLAAELLGLQFRDFRRTCVVILGELGLADHLVAAITGHSLDETKRILEVYMPRTTGMAARAIMMSAERDARAVKKEGQTKA
ncbi:site-specific integrase [soil metagenome]